jgi:trk system potassium uptake protein TrkA
VRIVIVGAGEVGFAVASQLSQEGHDVTVVEADEAKATKVENELDVMVLASVFPVLRICSLPVRITTR